MPHVDSGVRAAYMKAYRARNAARLRADRLVWEDKHKEARAEYSKTYRAANSGPLREYARSWSLNNTERVRGYRQHTNHTPSARTARARYKTANPAKQAAYWAAREARKIKATPTWSNKAAIDAVYELARLATELTGIRHSVDHMVPLRSKTVCGLHVQWNLRVVSQSENSVKGNRHWPGMP